MLLEVGGGRLLGWMFLPISGTWSTGLLSGACIWGTWFGSSRRGWRGLLGLEFILCPSLECIILMDVAYSARGWWTPCWTVLLGVSGALSFFVGGLDMTCSTAARRSSMLGICSSGIWSSGTRGFPWISLKYSWIRLDARSGWRGKKKKQWWLMKMIISYKKWARIRNRSCILHHTQSETKIVQQRNLKSKLF